MYRICPHTPLSSTLYYWPHAGFTRAAKGQLSSQQIKLVKRILEDIERINAFGSFVIPLWAESMTIAEVARNAAAIISSLLSLMLSSH